MPINAVFIAIFTFFIILYLIVHCAVWHMAFNKRIYVWHIDIDIAERTKYISSETFLQLVELWLKGVISTVPGSVWFGSVRNRSDFDASGSVNRKRVYGSVCDRSEPSSWAGSVWFNMADVYMRK